VDTEADIAVDTEADIAVDTEADIAAGTEADIVADTEAATAVECFVAFPAISRRLSDSDPGHALRLRPNPLRLPR
jgi:hypothetical protein